jgi:hypothetical protein
VRSFLTLANWLNETVVVITTALARRIHNAVDA